MKFPWICLVGLTVVVSLAGCGGGEPESPAPSSEGAGEEDLTKRWGPEEMPDQDAEPLQFLYWRVDQMFDKSDADQDGRLTPDEFEGLSHNFERLDADGSGFLTKKEIIDDMSEKPREQGRIP